MAKGNGKNGNGQNGNGAQDGSADEGTTSNGANGFRAGRGVSGPKEWSVAEPPAAPAIVVPPRSLTPLVVGAAALALGGGAIYAVHRWRQQQRVALDPGTPEPGRTPGASTPTAEAPAPEAPAAEAPTSETPASEAPADPGSWGTTKRGEQYRPLFTKLEEVTGMPLRLYLCVVANREAGWSRTARNKTKVEVKASADGIDNGLKRGNPAPKFATSIRDAGSGGLFGALAPFVAWTGMDEGYMPYLDEDWPIIEDPIVSAVFAAKYYQRIVGGGRYPVFADPSKPSPEDNYRVRLGWASPSALKSSPNGTLFQNVKKRFDIDLAELGLKISDLPPPNAEQWPGLKAVVAGLKGFPVTWK
jgi:hypothetical protein